MRGEAEVVGISLATIDRVWYFPFGHLGGGNMDREPVCRFFRSLLNDPNKSIVGAHLLYDIEGLDSLGIDVHARCLDVQIAEPLLDEELPSYSLDSLCKRHLGIGKREDELREAANLYGVDAKKELWKLHSRFVGPYAEADSSYALQIFQKQLRRLEAEELLDIFQLESELLPIIYKMRKLGLRVDLDKAKQLLDEVGLEESVLSKELANTYNLTNVWSGPKIASCCDSLGLSYPRTPGGAPSFESGWLDLQEHQLFAGISKLREINRLRSTYIKEWIFGNEIDGVIHPDWRQLKRDEGGTRTGRMASSHPNCQQVPARSEIGERIRGLFIPRDGKRWAKVDYSQQEPRLLVHYAALCKFSGAQEAADRYRGDKGLDIYQFLAESCNLGRRDAKDATLGRMYGMGVPLFATSKGITEEEARRKLEAFDNSVPFVKELANYCCRMAEKRGWIKTLGGRKRHFNFYEPRDSYDLRKQGIDCHARRHEAARDTWQEKPLKRAFGYKALNSLIQGSAADMIKRAMVDIYQKTGLVPYSAVHDELNYGVEGEEQAKEVQKLMEEAYKLEVPVLADLDLGDSWK